MRSSQSRWARSAASSLGALLVVGLLTGTPASATAQERKPPKCPASDVTLFAGGGTPLSNGSFFPGTATYYENEWIGEPLVVPQGCNVKFVNLDVGTLTNGHQIVSLKTRRGDPLFMSRYVVGPDTATVRTRRLKQGTYPYFCSVHYGMWGLLQIEKV